ncbi:MAG TPA: M56 family metallopeptidase [Bryobacteraceae bacterium]
MIPSQLQPLANHVWQSTLFAGLAGLLTLALRPNRAQTRYWLWLAASVKFLIPFSLLVDVGSHWGRLAPITPRALWLGIEQTSQPFSVPVPLATTTAGPPGPFVDWVPGLLYFIWAIGFTTVICSWWRRWRGLRLALRTALPVDLPIGIKTMASPAFAAPGVFGVRRPILLLPTGITDRLTPAQLEAIVAHEMCHVRRRDNLATAIHMGVEALFWFHPPVWWLGARLMEERERACDEEVLLMGSAPEVYAESILRICELCLESPLPCVSGVTGANLRKRIEDIMTKRIAARLSFAKKAVLAVGGTAALGLPILAGIMSTTGIRAQPPSPQSAAGPFPKFEAVSIKPCKPGASNGSPGVPPGAGSSRGRLRISCGILADIDNTGMIQIAYNRYASGYLSSFRVIPIEGGPGWIHSERFDIDAKSDGQPSILMMQGPMMQAVLEDRFKLRIHRETRQGAVYELTLGKGAPRLKPLQEGSCTPVTIGRPLPELTGDQRRCRNMANPRGVDFEGGTLAMFAGLLGMILDRPVIDKTGITDLFTIHLEFSPDEFTSPRSAAVAPAAVGGPEAPGIFQAVQEQLGLKLVPAKGPVDFLVIDHIERPSEN